MNQQELNDAIALQLGRLLIENQALKLRVAALQDQLAPTRPAPEPAPESGP